MPAAQSLLVGRALLHQHLHNRKSHQRDGHHRPRQLLRRPRPQFPVHAHTSRIRVHVPVPCGRQ